MEFVAFGKIPRLRRPVCVTEKIDGTNGQVNIRLASETPDPFEHGIDTQVEVDGVEAYLRAGSRNRWLPNGGPAVNDNYGFGHWVYQNAPALAALGKGAHFGEWWGLGIARNYGAPNKRFSLFNTLRWGAHNPQPSCCLVVPILFQGEERYGEIQICLDALRFTGSAAFPGFMKPEGVIVYHSAARQYFKQTIDKDAEPKSLASVTKIEALA